MYLQQTANGVYKMIGHVSVLVCRLVRVLWWLILCASVCVCVWVSEMESRKCAPQKERAAAYAFYYPSFVSTAASLAFHLFTASRQWWCHVVALSLLRSQLMFMFILILISIFISFSYSISVLWRASKRKCCGRCFCCGFMTFFLSN